MIRINVIDPEFIDVSFFVDHGGFEPNAEHFKKEWHEALSLVRKEYPNTKSEFVMTEVMKLLESKGYTFSKYESNPDKVKVYLS